jgi:hypothetical protein
MSSTIREHVEEQARRIPDERLDLVSAFLDALSYQEVAGTDAIDDDARAQDLLLLAEQSLRAEWSSPEEDAAWAPLAELPACRRATSSLCRFHSRISLGRSSDQRSSSPLCQEVMTGRAFAREPRGFTPAVRRAATPAKWSPPLADFSLPCRHKPVGVLELRSPGDAGAASGGRAGPSGATVVGRHRRFLSVPRA